MPITTIRQFLKLEAASGIILIIASVLALIMANSALSGLYTAILDIPVAMKFGALEIAKPLILWINDGLMAIFFFLVGLEIKREFVEGELSTPSQFALPAMAAVGGMAVPALIYYAINHGNPVNMAGWAIPTATDIAFALGILALVGSRAPLSLKILLTAIAIIDDLGAIVIIALFYTENLSIPSLMLGGVFIAGMVIANRLKIVRPSIYIILGIALWVCVLKSGVHATLAGVATAFAIPLEGREGSGTSPLKDLEHTLHPWVAFLIIPIFAFANAGVSFAGIGLENFIEPVKLGISAGLFFGKQVGVFLMIWLTIKLGLSAMPRGTNWLQLYAVSLLCGIGFTMSLFIGALAFEGSEFDVPVRLGVLTGSILSAVLGFLLLRFSSAKVDEATAETK
ncbi:MAG: Na+/H+ antiporter NhaA [Alphaproteobacteria bacterium]|nr:Na+/H+ antiporter NhaA [Rhodospirillales bacterium]MCW9046135.1 Na+/H+ antiporter NhaA [Alphaproteobacteria bacterium]